MKRDPGEPKAAGDGPTLLSIKVFKIGNVGNAEKRKLFW